MEQSVDEFEVLAKDGQVFRVVEYRKVINAGTMDNPEKKLFGKLAHFQTSEGYEVSLLSDGTFHIVKFDLKAKRIL